MGKVLDWLSWLVTARPWGTLAVLAIVTVVLAAGIGQRAPVAENESFLPDDSDVARAMDEIDALFGASHLAVVTLVFRGDVLTPGGLAQADGLLRRIVADPDVAQQLAPVDPIIAPTLLMAGLLQTDDFGSVTQEQIDAALEYVRTAPEAEQARAALQMTTGTDTDGTPIGVATVRLRDTDDDPLNDAELQINELATGDEGPLRVTSVSISLAEEEYREATGPRLLPLMGIALLVIALLTLLFMRTLSNTLLTLAGLFLALLWTTGAEGWLGPGALDLIGPPNALTAVVPLILISLTVDYSIQAVAQYREQRLAGEPVAGAVRTGLHHIVMPLALAAATTVVSFLTNLLSRISAISDFGVVAGVGVGLSLIVMLTLVPAVRLIIDRRHEARGTLRPPRPISSALPGIDRAAERLGTSISRRPTPYIVAVVAVTVGLGFAATRLTTDFSVRDLIPRDGSVHADLDTLDAAVGGYTEVASVLVKAEVTETRTLHNLFDITEAFEDERSRPRGVEGVMEASLALLVLDWITDDGAQGDRYEPEL